jgi:hypothetical protein
MRGGTGGSRVGDGTVSMTATDACLTKLGLSKGGFDPGCESSGLPLNVERGDRPTFSPEREADGLVRPDGTASRE